jgi:chlorobactene glucosyltransferase
MVVIPARNEEVHIGRVVKSLPPDTVIVVDDHSEDGTAEEARKCGAGVLPAPDLASGVVGKCNACAAGAHVLTSRWILFADADTWYEPGFLDAVVAAADAAGLNILSVYLQLDPQTLAERILIPYAVALFFCGMNPRLNPSGILNGQCLLVRREAYEFIGGHSAILTSMVEDVKLAELAKRHRMKFGVARTDRLGHVRMHAGLRGIWRGFERNAFRFMLVSPGAGIRILIAASLTALWLPALAFLIADRQPLIATAFFLVPAVLLTPWYRSWPRALLAPLAIYGMLPILFTSAVAAFTGREVEWKGRLV